MTTFPNEEITERVFDLLPRPLLPLCPRVAEGEEVADPHGFEAVNNFN